METQTWLSCHYKFISVENITLLSISSDDILHALLEVAEQQMWSYSSHMKKKKKNSLAWAGGRIQTMRCLKHQETIARHRALT